MNIKGLVKRVYWRAIQSRLFDKIRPRISHVRFFLLEGKTKGGFDLSILVFADHENVVLYLSNLVYVEKPKTTPLGRTSYRNIPFIIADSKADIVFAEFNGILCDFFSRSFLILPRVNFALDLSPSWENVVAGMRRIRRRIVRKIEELPYDYEVTNDPQKFEFFYHEMYLPFISRNPEDSARLTPKALAREWFQNGELTLVKSNDKYLAGVLYHPENGSTHCRLVAYDDGTACQAGFYSMIKKAKEKGHTGVNYGETPPFMRDGLFLYKRSWGMKMKPKLDTAYAIKFCNFEEPVQDFLANNPFIFTDLRNLMGLTLSNTDALDFNSLRRKYYTPGLAKLVTLYPTNKGVKPPILPAEDLPNSASKAMISLIGLVSERNFAVRLSHFSE